MGMDQMLILNKVLHRIKKYLPAMIGSLVLAFTYVAINIYIPILVGKAIDTMIGKGKVDFTYMLVISCQVLTFMLVAGIAQWVMNQLNNHITYSVTRDIRDEAFCHIQSLPLSYLDRHQHGDMVSRVIADADTFADGLLMGFTQLFTGVMTIVGTLAMMLVINWKIALVVVVLTPLSLVVANFITKSTYSMFQKQNAARGAQTALVDETIGQMKVVKAFGHEAVSMEQFDDANEQLRKYSLRAIFYSSLTNPGTRFVYALVYAGVALVGAIFAISGGITVGYLSSFLSYANQYTKPFNEISGVIAELQNALTCAGRVFELIEVQPMTPDGEDCEFPGEVKGAVEMTGVDFSYTPEKPLIRDFNLSVAPGQRVAIVGPTGCGKTTLINLLMRFYDPNDGSISLDGVNTKNMERKALRGCIGMVLQDTWLRSGTIRENIAMGRPDATDEQIIDAAKQAHAHSFIKRLPHGYDTVIGEGGGNFSQGQKQLLCIARVMLCLPPILILDEATSSIDTRTEIRIQKAFNAMMEGRTSFVVAHRLSTIREADVILVMRDGQVVEQGTHEGLLATDGFYSQLYKSQFAQ